MKFLIQLILITATAYFVQPYTPWWIVVVIPFITALLIRSSGPTAFFSGFLGIGALWLWKSWMIDHETHSILSNKIAALFGVPEAIYLVLITGLIGAIAAGFGGLSGHTFIKIFERKRRLYY